MQTLAVVWQFLAEGETKSCSVFIALLCFCKQGGPGPKLLTTGKNVLEKRKAGEKGEGTSISTSQPKPSCQTSNVAVEGDHVRLKPGKESHKSGDRKQDSAARPSHHSSASSPTVKQPSENDANHRHAAGSEDEVPKQPPSSLFYKQSGTSLSLFRQSKSVEERCNSRLYHRRGSEPGWQIMDKASTLTRARLPSDPGLKVTEVDSQGGTTEARFCLSPCATKAVRDYFCSHPYSDPHSSQQVALALVENHRKWLKRCNDPTAEPDFEQLLFAEESYVWWTEWSMNYT